MCIRGLRIRAALLQPDLVRQRVQGHQLLSRQAQRRRERHSAIGQTLAIPALPPELWLSTVILLASSGSMQWALVAGRAGDQGRLKVAMAATTALGLVFLLVQGWCWVAWAGPMQVALGETDYAFLLTSFFVLTGLHALHVVGGLVAVGIVTARAMSGRYTPRAHAGVVYTAMYWHFLGAVWLVLFATLMVG